MLGRPRDDVLQAVDRGSKAEDFQQRGPRFLVRFLHALRAAPLLQQIRHVSLRHAELRVQRHHLLTLRFPLGVNVAPKRRRAEGRNIRPPTSPGQPVKLLPLVLDDLRPRDFFLLLLDVRDDHFAAHFDQAAPGRLLDFMHRIAPFGRTLELVEHLRKRLGHLAKPILNLDNHRSGSCGRTLKHCCTRFNVLPWSPPFCLLPRNNRNYASL